MTGGIIDVSTPVEPGCAVWPGDTDYGFELHWRKPDTGSVNVGRLVMSTHTGTHADAPYHFADEGAGVDGLALEPFVGPARVVDAAGLPHVGAEQAREWDLRGVRRLLIRTGGWSDRRRFPPSFPFLLPDLADALAAHGGLLVGVDLPSVDPVDSKELLAHHALHRHGIAILEGLELSDVAPGDYELIALPLPLTGADASPVRAVLRPMTAWRDLV